MKLESYKLRLKYKKDVYKIEDCFIFVFLYISYKKDFIEVF